MSLETQKVSTLDSQASPIPDSALFYTIVSSVDKKATMAVVYSSVKSRMASDTVTVSVLNCPTVSTDDLWGLNSGTVFVHSDFQFAGDDPYITSWDKLSISAPGTLTIDGSSNGIVVIGDVDHTGGSMTGNILSPASFGLSQVKSYSAQASNSTVTLNQFEKTWVEGATTTGQNWNLRLPTLSAVGWVFAVTNITNGSGTITVLDGANSDAVLATLGYKDILVARKAASHWLVISDTTATGGGGSPNSLVLEIP